MELRTWGSLWDLPSGDVATLTVLTYIRFFGKVKPNVLSIVPVNDVREIPAGFLPALIDKDLAITDFPAIIGHLRKNGINIDGRLSAQEGAETVAFEALLEECLFPAVQYHLWGNAKNSSAVADAYSKIIPFPFGYYNILKLRARATLSQSSRSAPEILSKMETCLQTLRARLARNQYFFGDRPSYLDAVVFAHLVVLVKAGVDCNTTVQSTSAHTRSDFLRSDDVLLEYVNRIYAKFFSDCETSNSSGADASAPWFVPQLKKNLVSFSIATAAMTLYGLSLLVRLAANRAD